MSKEYQMPGEMLGSPLILFAQQRIFHSRGHRTDPDWRAGLVGGIACEQANIRLYLVPNSWRAGLVGGIACEGHRILVGIGIFILEESTQPFDFRKRFFFSCQGVFFQLSLFFFQLSL